MNFRYIQKEGMYATKSLPPPTTPPPEESDLVGDPGLYWSSDPVDQDHSTREVSSYLARPNPSVSNCGLVIVQVDRRVGDDNHHVPEDHRTYWHPQSLLMPMTQTVGHHLIHHGQTTSLGQDESDDGYRTHSSSSSCSDGNSPQSQLSAESPPPGKPYPFIFTIWNIGQSNFFFRHDSHSGRLEIWKILRTPTSCRRNCRGRQQLDVAFGL